MKRAKHKFLFNLLLLTIFFNVWFPKAGIKVSGIPLTIGIVFFVVLSALWGLSRIRNKTKINKLHRLIIIAQLFFLFRMIISYMCGIKVTDMVEYAIPLIIFPFILFYVTDLVDTSEKYDKIMSLLICGFIFLCIYSILQAIFGIGKIDIPGLTVNYTDYKTLGTNWFMKKNNGIQVENAKIVATYQNGNVFGIGLLIIFPIIYDWSLKKGKHSIVFLGLFILTELMTLSRTCWIGLVLFFLFRIVFSKNYNTKQLLKKIMILFSVVALSVIVFKYVPSVSDRFLKTDFDSFMKGAGRTNGAIEYLDSFWNDGNIIVNLSIGSWGFIEEKGLSYEMTQLAIMRLSGFIGLFVWTMQFAYFGKFMKNASEICKSYVLAIILYFLVALIEGAYWLPPTALNLFMIMGLGVAYKNISVKEEIVL